MDNSKEKLDNQRMIWNESMTEINLKDYIKNFKNFPKEGILFRDIMPLFANNDLLQKTIISLCHKTHKVQAFDALVGVESRGFLIGTPMAFHLKKSFIVARKKGKLPGDIVAETYALEYGHDTIEIQHAHIIQNKSYLIVDDLLATGGTACATARLIKKYGGHIAGFVFLVELTELQGRKKIQNEFANVPCEAVVIY